MKNVIPWFFINLITITWAFAQSHSRDEQQLYSLIDKYSLARETKDAELLKNILTTEVDQLVSSGVWRIGKDESMKGMLRSSSSNPGTRTLTIEKIRFLNSESAIVDTRYEIQNADGTARKMWSTFVVVRESGAWQITAIRNMLPANRDTK